MLSQLHANVTRRNHRRPVARPAGLSVVVSVVSVVIVVSGLSVV